MRRGWGRAAGLAGVALAAVLPAAAGPLAETAATAIAAVEARLAAGEGPAAIAALDPLIEAVWAAAPLGFATALLVSATPTGYGLYTPRPPLPFAPGEPIRIYAEPVGFGHGRSGEFWEVAFDVDLAILEPASRRTIATIEGIDSIALRSRARLREFPASITYEWRGARSGRYLFVTTLRDRHSGKSGSFELLVEVAE